MMAPRHIHVIGGGVAGLSAALQLSLMGEKTTLYEAAPFGGGRCRSYFDNELDCRLDNGNHLVLSGNAAIQDYLFLTGATETMTSPANANFPFMDLANGQRWLVEMSEGRLPFWIFDKNRRVAGTKPADYLSVLSILTAQRNDTVTQRLDVKSTLYRRFWEPLTIAALNTEPEISSARLLANIFWQTFAAGGQACRPMIPKAGLSESFVNPAVETLRRQGVEIKFNHRLRSLHVREQRVRALQFGNRGLEMGPRDWVVIAVPAWIARELLPGLSTPDDFRSIVNAHFKVDVPRDPTGIVGLIGGMAEWVFAKDGVASVTVSAGERYMDLPVRDMARHIWRDLARLYNLDPEKTPPHRIFKEKFATFAATPAQDARRPKAFDFRWKNVALAGEWTATGLPSTIEGAIRSGFKASQVVSRWE